MDSTTALVVAALEAGHIRDVALTPLLERRAALAAVPAWPRAAWEEAPALAVAVDRVLGGADLDAVVDELRAAREAHARGHDVNAVRDAALYRLDGRIGARLRSEAFVVEVLRPAFAEVLDAARRLADPLAPLAGHLGDARAVAGASAATRRAFETLVGEVAPRFATLVALREANHGVHVDTHRYFRDLVEPPVVPPGVRVVTPSAVPPRGPAGDGPERLLWLASQSDAVMPTARERAERWERLLTFVARQPSPPAPVVRAASF